MWYGIYYLIVVKMVKVKMVKMNFGFGHLLTIYKNYLYIVAVFDK